MTTTAFDQTLSSLGIDRTTTATTAAAANTSSSAQMSQADFLKLMTAQLNYQDPFNPVDNTQMVAQMAQFSSLAGISQMNTTLQSISDRLGATTASDALSYVGHNVLTEGSTAYGRTAGGIAGAVEVGAAATDVTVSIADSSGNVLKTMNLGAHDAGTVNYDWDGTAADGTVAGSGPFTVTATAHNGTSTVATHNLVWAPVTSVSAPGSGSTTSLSVAGIGTIPVTAVRQIG